MRFDQQLKHARPLQESHMLSLTEFLLTPLAPKENLGIGKFVQTTHKNMRVYFFFSGSEECKLVIMSWVIFIVAMVSSSSSFWTVPKMSSIYGSYTAIMRFSLGGGIFASRIISESTLISSPSGSSL